MGKQSEKTNAVENSEDLALNVDPDKGTTRAIYFRWALLGVVAYAIAAGLLLLFLPSALPLPAALLLSWLLGGIAAVGGAYALARRRAARAAGEPASLAQPAPGIQSLRTRDRYAAGLKAVERYLSTLA